MASHDPYLLEAANTLHEQEKAPSNHHGEALTVSGGDGGNEVRQYLQGKPFYLTTAAWVRAAIANGRSHTDIIYRLAVQVFMVQMEIPVVTTSLVAITSELHGLDQISWVVTSYLLGYVGMMCHPSHLTSPGTQTIAAVIVIFAKFSDVLGRKFIFALSIVIFIIFSAACSAAQTMAQLIIFRAFQGIGGGGAFSLSQVIVTDLVPPERYAKYVSQLSIVSSFALLLGPIVGGSISSHTTWRWIFIINVPIASLALVFTIIGMPGDFGLLRQSDRQMTLLERMTLKSNWRRIDIPGTILLLCAVLSLTAGFEEAGADFPWKSAYVITLLSLSSVFWMILLFWERKVTLEDSVREPVLPWRFFTNRSMVGALLGLLFLGGPIIVPIFQLPERFQLVYGLSGLDAGIRLLPFSFAVPAGTAVVSAIGGKIKVPSILVILLGSCLQIIGFGLLGTLPATLNMPARIYGFEVLAGFGCGMNFMPLFLMIPNAVSIHDQAVGMGAGNQFRMIGSAIVIAASTSVLHSILQDDLSGTLGIPDTTNILTLLGHNFGSLPDELQNEIRSLLGKGYNRQMFVLCASAAAQIPSAMLLWRKDQITI